VVFLISCNTKSSQNNTTHDIFAQEINTNKLATIENTITINGETFNLISDDCIQQINDDHSWLTFKASNDDLEYSLSVVLGVFNEESFKSGKYITNYGDTQADFMIINLITEDADYGNTLNSFVEFTNNGNIGLLQARDISLGDNYETLPNITVSFQIRCNL
jgi:hypothetical protein